MKKTPLLLLIALLAVTTGFSQSAPAKDNLTVKPRYCILYIGDGFGTSAKTAARMSLGQGTLGKRFPADAGFQVLALDKLRFSTSVTTHSANSWITDSGPGASAYAAGEKGKIDNEAISFNVATNQSVETILEAAKKQGYAVGLITTTRITHATPATFATHIWFRDLEDYIASQYISSTEKQYEDIYNAPSSTIRPYNPARDWQLPVPKRNVEVDVLLGGGLRHFYPNGLADTVKDASGTPILNAGGSVVTQGGRRTDMVDLVSLATQRGYVYINSRDALLNLDTAQFQPGSDKKLLGLFNSSHLNYEQDRQLNAEWEPSLPEMVEIAIKVLKAKGGEKGFFLMVEGGRIDHLEHANEGGITVVAGSPNNQYTVDADKPVYAGGGDANYSATPTTPQVPGLYGSDYLLKEVLAFDYAVAQGRKLLEESATSNTLIFSTSDHECGGTAIVGLHDVNDAQGNGTMVRTYALGPKQKGVSASSSGAATATTWATPVYLERGDIDFGAKNPSGWYPDYSTYTFQGRPELWPKADTNGRRIVIAFGSNPLTNGNGTKAGGTPGNHTPMDIWVGADMNVPNGDLLFARQFVGKGLIDNTSLTPIMAKFLKVNYPFDAAFAPETTPEVSQLKKAAELNNAFSLKTFPNPARNQVNIEFILPSNDPYRLTVADMKGNIVKTMKGSNEKGYKKFVMDAGNLTPGIYIAKLKVEGNEGVQEQVSKIIIQR